MTIYISLVEDRHYGIDVNLFSTQEKAIAFAESVMEEHAHTARYVQEDDYRFVVEYLLFFGQYSVEGDCVSVFAKEIDES